MDLELLRTFLEVSRTRSFGRSAEALGVTQAAVSQRIRVLEDQLGIRLFDRTTREIRMTSAGNRLIAHADRQIAAWRAARQDVSPTDSNQQLAVGSTPRIAMTLFQPWLHALRLRLPKLAIVAECAPQDSLTRSLIDGTMDVAIMLEPAQLEVFQISEVASIELILVSSRAGIHAQDALASDYVYVDWGLTHGLDHRRAFPDAPEAITRVSEASMALNYISQIGGSAYLPRRMIEKQLADGTIFTVAGAPAFSRTAYAAYLLRSARREFIESCIAVMT